MTMKEEQGSLFTDDFIEYDRKHPQIWKAFKSYTFQTIEKGFKHHSARAIFHIIRWHTGVNAEFPDGFKVNNTYSPYYARKFMREYPQHKDFFRMRSSKFDTE